MAPCKANSGSAWTIRGNSPSDSNPRPLDGAEKLIGYTLAPFSIDGEATLDSRYRRLQLQPLELQFEKTHDPSDAVSVRVPPVEILQEGGLGADVRVQAVGGAIQLGKPGIEIEGIEFDLDWSASSGLPRGRIEVSKILLSGSEPWLAPLTLHAEIAPGDETLTADIDLTDPSRRFILRVQATQDLKAAAGSARIRLAPLEFGGPGADLGRLLPGLGRLGIEAWGELTLRGKARWTSETAGLTFAVGLQNVSVSMGSTQISCLNGVIELQGLPLETAGAQEVSMARMDIGLQLRDGRVRFRLQPTGELIVERGEWSAAGGKILTAGQYDAGREFQDFLLAVDRVQFAELIGLLPVEGLTGSGVLSGRLPVRLADDHVEIRGGILASEGDGGWLRYRPEEGARRLADYGVPELMDLEAVLENFSIHGPAVTDRRQHPRRSGCADTPRGSQPRPSRWPSIRPQLECRGPTDRSVLRRRCRIRDPRVHRGGSRRGLRPDRECERTRTREPLRRLNRPRIGIPDTPPFSR